MKNVDSNRELLDFSRLPDNLTPVYALPVINAGADNCQALSSYMSNLAAKHRLSLKTMFKFIRTYCEGYTIAGSSIKYIDTCRLDAGGDYSASLVDAIQIMTGVSVSGCCWLKLRRALAGNFIGIIRANRQWCTQCYRESRDAHGIVYEPLLWSFPGATACPVHNALFEEFCPSCGQRQPIMCAQANHWYCNYCCAALAGLGAKPKTRVDAQVMAWNLWLQRELGLLVSALWDPGFNPQAKNFRHFVKLLAQDDPRGYRGVAQRTGMSEYTLSQWVRKGPPAFDLFLKLCAVLGASPVSALSAPREAINELGMWPSPVSPEPFQKRLNLGTGDWPKIRQQLQQMAAGNAAIPRIREICRMVGVSPGTLRYREPKLLQELVAKRDCEKKRAREIARKQQYTLGRKVFMEMRRRGLHITRRSFEKEFLGRSSFGYRAAAAVYTALYRGS